MLSYHVQSMIMSNSFTNPQMFPCHEVIIEAISVLRRTLYVHITSPMQGDILSISRKIDANWYEGFLGDKKGIFPVAYVEVIEGKLNTLIQ